MGKKSKKRGANRNAPAEATPPPPAAEPKALLGDFARYPTLVLAWITLGITVFSVGVALRFRDHLEMGAIREPTGSIIWAAITLTLFASYWRQRQRDSEPPKDS